MPKDTNGDDKRQPISLAGTRPANAANGLNAIYAQLVENPGERRTAVVEFDCQNYSVDTDEGTVSVTVRFRQIEPLSGDAAATARHLLDQAQAARAGQFDFAPQGQETSS
jgi:hypothetical protein